MSVDIRLYTRAIICKDGQYLLSVNEFTKEPRWNSSPYEAWWTRDMNAAVRVAKKLNARPVLFNPVVGKVKQLTYFF